VTSQDHATAALQAWQSLRELPPEDRMSILMADFFLSEENRQYEATLRNVQREMAA